MVGAFLSYVIASGSMVRRRPVTSFLVTSNELRELLDRAGFRVTSWVDATDSARKWFASLAEKMRKEGFRRLGFICSWDPTFESWHRTRGAIWKTGESFWRRPSRGNNCDLGSSTTAQVANVDGPEARNTRRLSRTGEPYGEWVGCNRKAYRQRVSGQRIQAAEARGEADAAPTADDRISRDIECDSSRGMPMSDQKRQQAS